MEERTKWLGEKWERVLNELAEKDADFEYKITYPAGRSVSCGELRVARITCEGEKLKFILLQDRFIP